MWIKFTIEEKYFGEQRKSLVNANNIKLIWFDKEVRSNENGRHFVVMIEDESFWVVDWSEDQLTKYLSGT
jgi:hypothetical protein